jgi:hypothetical protein
VVANGAGASAQQSLGTVIFGGLIVATVLSIGVVPPVYVLVKDLESRLMSPSKLTLLLLRCKSLGPGKRTKLAGQ